MEHDNDLARGSGFGFAENVNRLLARVFPFSERSDVNVLEMFISIKLFRGISDTTGYVYHGYG